MHKRGNISILVIFVLLASSLLGVLSMNFVQQMMKQSAVIHSYYKSYYLAKAGIELGLTQISSRGVGFNYTANTGDAVMSGNFLCRDNCHITMSVSGTAAKLSKKFWQEDMSGCVFPYVLSGGDSIIVPLFRDATAGSVRNTLQSGVEYQNLAEVFKQGEITFIASGVEGKLVFGILLMSGQDLYENGLYFQQGAMNVGLSAFRDAFQEYYAGLDSLVSDIISNNYTNPDFPFTTYLLISNNDTYEQSFCLDLKNYLLPTDTFFLHSKAGYGNQQVTLDAVYAQPIPGFLFNSYSSF